RAGGVPMTEWYFVWVEGLRGPMPQKWSSDGLWGQVGRQDVIVRFTLSDEERHLPLDELARRHPIHGAREREPCGSGCSAGFRTVADFGLPFCGTHPIQFRCRIEREQTGTLSRV